MRSIPEMARISNSDESEEQKERRPRHGYAVSSEKFAKDVKAV